MPMQINSTNACFLGSPYKNLILRADSDQRASTPIHNAVCVPCIQWFKTQIQNRTQKPMLIQLKVKTESIFLLNLHTLAFEKKVRTNS